MAMRGSDWRSNWTVLCVVRPLFPMMMITSSMMMMMSFLVDSVGEEVANQSNSGLQHSSTLGAWVGPMLGRLRRWCMVE